MLDGVGKAGRVEGGKLQVRLRVVAQRAGAEEAEDGGQQRVVHERVEAVAVQPLRGLAPDFADEVGIGVGRLHHVAELAPEGRIVDFVRHVEAPAVDAEVNPVLGHVEQEVLDLGVVGVKLRQGRQVVPGVVIVVLVGGRVRMERPVMDDEPVGVGGVGAVFEDVVEGPEAAARVVEDTVEHDADAAGVGGVEQFAQRVVAAEQGVDLVVVVRVVAVVGRRGEDGIQIEGGNAQVVQVVEVVDDAVEVAALKPLFFGRGAPRLEGDLLLLGHLSAPGKAVREDLVEDGVLCPVGGGHGAW